MKTSRILLLATTAFLLTTLTASAEVRLPKIFTSHMVLQREMPVTIWGWAAPGETVTVQILKDKQATKANDKGEWKVTLASLKAGGPVTVTVSGTTTITLEDVLVGEVWVCSGQSNMQMAVGGCEHAADEIAAANLPGIRLFTVTDMTAPTPSTS